MLKVKSGQLDLLGLLFERYNRPLYGFFLKLTYDQDLSEDLVQNVFMRIIKYRHTYKGDGKFSTWMFHMARNLFADHYRKEKRKGYKEDISSAEQQLSDGLNAEQQRIVGEELTLLDRAMQTLPEEKREVLVLSKYQGMKYQDIAELLEISESAVKVRIFRALKQLRATYEKLETGVIQN